MSKTSGLRPFQPGNPGGPGRPKGSRNKLAESFTQALLEDFEANGKEAIEAARAESPAQYMRTIASLLPKEVKIETNPVGELSDDELAHLIATVRELEGVQAAPRARLVSPGGSETSH